MLGTRRVVVITTGDGYSKLLYAGLIAGQESHGYQVVGVVDSRLSLRSKALVAGRALRRGALFYLGYMATAALTLKYLNAVGRLAPRRVVPDVFASAKASALPVIRAPDLNQPAVIDELKKLEAELLLAIRPAQIIRRRFIESLPEIRNVHTTALPAYRGIGGVFRTLLHGETHTAVTVHRIDDERIDAGPIVFQEPMSIHRGEPLLALELRLARACSRALPAAVVAVDAEPQDERRASTFSWPTWAEMRRFKASGKRFFGMPRSRAPEG